MVFAMNFPYLQAWFTSVEKLSTFKCVALKSIVGGLWAGATYWWYHNIYTLPKYEFNAAHSYWFWIPVLAYIYFRNLTPLLRSYHSSLLNWGGKITLETYLLQFHVFMRAHQDGAPWKPEQLLALLPNYPLCNLLLTGVLFVICAKLAFNATLTLRDLLIGESTRDDMLARAPYVLAGALGLVLFAAVADLNDDGLVALGCVLTFASFVLVFFWNWKKA